MGMNLKEHGGFPPAASQEKKEGWARRSWGWQAGPPSLWALSQGQWEASTTAQSRGAMGSGFSFDRFTLAAIRIAREQGWGRGDSLGSCCSHRGQRMSPGAGK